MSLEQTTQLIQLILNAVLMLGACGMMLCAALMHQIMLENRFRSGNLAQRWSPTDRRSSARHQRFRQQRQTRRSVFWLSGAGWAVGMSCGALVLRSVWQVNELIGLSLVLFAGACGLFVVGTGWLIVSVMTTSKNATENPELVRSGIRSNHRSRHQLSKRSGAELSPNIVDFQTRGRERSGTAGDRKRP
jgi:hypothetical protein